MWPLAILVAAAVAANAIAAQAKVEAAPPTVIGPAISCVLIQNIRSTKVIDGRTIDFHMKGGKVLRNALPFNCPQLGFERAFGYATSINQLCSVDIITVIVQGSPSMLGASCGLGKFTPIAPLPRKTAGAGAAPLLTTAATHP